MSQTLQHVVRSMLVLAALAVGLMPFTVEAQRRGRNIPLLNTPNGYIRKSDYYAHLLTPQQRAEMRKTEDAFIEQVKKQLAARNQPRTQGTTPQSSKK